MTAKVIPLVTGFDKTLKHLANVRPIFDLMIERGVSRPVANYTMAIMLEKMDHECQA